jgi:hypothetical protein
MCKPKFIYTPQSVEFCMDISFIDILLISIKERPMSIFCLLSGTYLVLVPLINIMTFLKKRFKST